MNHEDIFVSVYVLAISVYALWYFVKLERHRGEILKQIGSRSTPAYRNYMKTVTRLNGIGRDVSFAKAADYINLNRVLKDEGLNMRMYLSIPSLLVGFGVLGTFIGFSMTLWSIETILDGSNPLDGMKKLFASVKVAFFTSVTGMFWSLSFSKYEKWVFNDLETKLQDICTSLDNRYYKAHDEYMREALFGFYNGLEDTLITNINSSFDAIKNNYEVKIAELLSGPTDALKQQSEVLGHQLNAWEASLNKQYLALHGATTQLESLLGLTQSRVDAIKLQIEAINSQVQAHVQQWTGAFDIQANLLKQQEGSIENLRSILAVIPVMTVDLGKINRAFDDAVRSFKITETSLSQGSKDISTSINSLSQLTAPLQQLSDSTQSIHSSVQLLENSIAAENSSLQNMVQALDLSVENLLRGLDDSIEKRLERTNFMLQNYFSEIDKIAEKIVSTYAQIGKH